jgi:putative transposase
MPWNECKPIDERLKFIGRLLEGEKMAPLCREFGISRVTGYKIFNRYKEVGLDALYDRSRAPYRQANRLPYQVERTILGIKKEHSSWGAPKIRDKLGQHRVAKVTAIPLIHCSVAGPVAAFFLFLHRGQADEPPRSAVRCPWPANKKTRSVPVS